MTTLDWIFAGVLLVSLVMGAWRGLVYEVLSLLGWVAAYFAARWFAPQVAEWLPLRSTSQTLRYAAAFVLVFIAVLIVAALLAALLKKMVNAAGLRPVDRTLGAAFGVLRGMLLLLAATVAVNMTALKSSPAWRESDGAGLLTATLGGLKPLLPEPFAKYLD